MHGLGLRYGCSGESSVNGDVLAIVAIAVSDGFSFCNSSFLDIAFDGLLVLLETAEVKNIACLGREIQL